MDTYNDKLLTGPVRQNARISYSKELIPMMCELRKTERRLLEMCLAKINPITKGEPPAGKVMFSIKEIKEGYRKGIKIEKIKEALDNLKDLKHNGKRILYRCYMTEDDKYVIMDLHYDAKRLFFDLKNYMSYHFLEVKDLTGKAYSLFVRLKKKTINKNRKICISKQEIIDILSLCPNIELYDLNRVVARVIKSINGSTNMKIESWGRYRKHSNVSEFIIKYK